MYSPYDWYITPDEYEEAARQGIPGDRVERRIRRLGWGKRKAITTPVKQYRNLSKLTAIANANGIDYSNLRNRLSRGWDEHRASTIPIQDAQGLRDNMLRTCVLNRKYPYVMIELAASNGISACCFRYRVRHGWDYIRAATLPPSPSNAPMRVKELYGEGYFKILWGWLFAPSRVKRGYNKKNP